MPQVRVNNRETELYSTFEISKPLTSRTNPSINLKDKSLHDFEDWLGFVFKCLSHHSQAKFPDLHLSNYWKKHL